MFDRLTEIFSRPEPFEHSNVPDLWNTPHIAAQMLNVHLNPDDNRASRKKSFIDKSVKWIVETANIDSNSKLLDLGCGPGLYTQRFAETGANVTGIDLSENSVRYAREQAGEANQDIHYINKNYLECDLGTGYDVITLIYCDFCVLSPGQRKHLLTKIYGALKENGYFFFDVHSVNHFNRMNENSSCASFETGGFWAPEKHFLFHTLFKYEKEHIILDKHTIIKEHDSFTNYNYLQCYELEEIKKELSACGFFTDGYYSDISGTEYQQDSNDIALVTRKKV